MWRVTVVLLACGKGRAPAPVLTNEICPASDRASFEACAGLRSTFDGQIASMVSQHPVMTGPGAPPPAYVDMPSVGQVVVEPRGEVTCNGSVTVEGGIERVDLGGAPGTKESYTGWRVTDALVTCR